VARVNLRDTYHFAQANHQLAKMTARFAVLRVDFAVMK
jgi:hypothetical protein